MQFWGCSTTWILEDFWYVVLGCQQNSLQLKSFLLQFFPCSAHISARLTGLIRLTGAAVSERCVPVPAPLFGSEAEQDPGTRRWDIAIDHWAQRRRQCVLSDVDKASRWYPAHSVYAASPPDRPHTVSQKTRKLWNGIAQNYKDRFWWHLVEIFKVL